MATDFQTDHEATMRRAWTLVCPRTHALELAKRGLISEKIAQKVSWKDQISAMVTDEMLNAAGVTVEQVLEAIEFYTATEATAAREEIVGLAWEKYATPRPGWLIQADGYYAGPAGP